VIQSGDELTGFRPTAEAPRLATEARSVGQQRGAVDLARWKPSVVLLDLGGVLFDYSSDGALEQMRGASFPEAELEDFWLKSHWAALIATGRCTPIEFALGAIDELRLDTTAGDFLSEFQTWLRGYLPGAESLLCDLAKSVRLSCFSNTNEIDAARFRSEFGVERHFEICFFSNEMGLRKPNQEAFCYVLDALQITASDVLFLDDTPECVEGARKSGIRSEVSRGPREARAALSRYFEPLVPSPLNSTLATEVS